MAVFLLENLAKVHWIFLKNHLGGSSALIETLAQITIATQVTTPFCGFWFRRDIYAKILNARLKIFRTAITQIRPRAIVPRYQIQ